MNKQRYFLLHNIRQKITKVYSSQYLFGYFYSSEDGSVRIPLIPSFDDIFYNRDMTCISFDVDGTTVWIKDIRLFNFIDAIKEKIYYVNPRYQFSFSNFFRSKNQKTIVRDTMSELSLCTNDSIHFIKQLTDMEKTAIEEIVAAIGAEGTFSQNKVCVASGISRAGMTNLIRKMEEFGVADIRYLGKAGTYCKILDENLLDIRGSKYRKDKE